MSPELQKLAEQAGILSLFLVSDGRGNTTVDSHGGARLEEFARMVAADCANHIEQEHRSRFGLYAFIAKALALSIRTKYGIK